MFAALDAICRVCRQPFTLTSGEQEFFDAQGLHQPKRWPACRAAARRNGPRDVGRPPRPPEIGARLDELDGLLAGDDIHRARQFVRQWRAELER